MNSDGKSYTNHLCHFCLKHTKKLKSIFEEIFDDSNSLGVIEFITLITNFKIKKENEFPKMFCTQCAKQIRNFMNFRITCIKSFEHLHKIRNDLITILFEPKEEPLENSIECESTTDYPSNLIETTVNYEDQLSDTSELKLSMKNEPIEENLKPTLEPKPKTRLKLSKNKQKSPKSDSLISKVEVNDNFPPAPNKQKVKKPRKKKKYPEATLCMICGQSFRWITNHLKSHSEDRPHHCDQCGKRFKLKRHLQLHIDTHLNLRLHKCDICGKGYNVKTCLQSHMLVHAGVRNHKCKICGLMFVLPSNLSKHMTTHEQNRRFECTECGKKFLTKTEHTQHTWVHTGEKPHPCKACDKRFRTAGMRRVHELRVHRDLFKKESKPD